jgi:hypothetical protein
MNDHVNVGFVITSSPSSLSLPQQQQQPLPQSKQLLSWRLVSLHYWDCLKVLIFYVVRMKSCKNAHISFTLYEYVQLSVWINLRTAEWIFMKFSFGSSATIWQHIEMLVKIKQYWQTLYKKTHVCFCTHLDSNSIIWYGQLNNGTRVDVLHHV